MSRIIGTDIDSSGGLPVSPDPELRRTEVEALKALLDTAGTPKDPAVAEMLLRIKEQLDLVGSPEAAIDSNGSDTEVARDTDSDTSNETVGGDAESTEFTAEDPRLAKLKADFDRGLRLIKADRTVEARPADLTWEKVVARLNEQNTVNPEKTNLEMAEAMQGGGELIGVDENGKLLIKDRGNEPVMFGIDQHGNTVVIYDRNPEEMAKVSGWANYWKIYEAVYGAEGKPTGYELFPDAPGYKKKGAIAAVEEVTKAPFVKSANGNEWRASWLDNGRNPAKNAIARVDFNPDYQRTSVYSAYPRDERGGLGAVRLLRV